MRTRTPPALQVLRTVVIADDESSMRFLLRITFD
jgi:hypothetical protein